MIPIPAEGFARLSVRFEPGRPAGIVFSLRGREGVTSLQGYSVMIPWNCSPELVRLPAHARICTAASWFTE
jgi:hypothetical protein